MSAMSNYDNEIVESLKVPLDNGEMIIDTNETKWIEEIESSYYIGQAGINWAKQKSILERIILGHDDISKKTSIDKFLNEIIDLDPALSKEKVVVIGDGLTENAYIMDYAFFIENNSVFLGIPQHTYVWFYNRKNVSI